MAENKKSVLLYVDLIHTVKKLSDVNAGLLFKHYLEYVNDLNPEPPNETIDLVFEPIKQTLKRDLKKYEGKKKAWSEAGKKSAEKRQQTSTNVNESKKRSTDSTVSVNVSDSVSVKDSVKVKDINKELKLPFSSDLFLENWNLLAGQPKWKKKTVSALQASLNKLGRFDEVTALKMIENCIAGGWQGLVEIKPEFKNGDKVGDFLKNIETARQAS